MFGSGASKEICRSPDNMAHGYDIADQLKTKMHQERSESGESSGGLAKACKGMHS